jgi:hypothetical protein
VPLQRPPSNPLVVILTVVFLMLTVAFFVLPWYDMEKGKRSWKRQEPDGRESWLQLDREFCQNKFHRDSTGFEMPGRDELFFMLSLPSSEERLRPCLEERGWEWQGD